MSACLMHLRAGANLGAHGGAFVCVCLLRPKRDIPSPACAQERAQGWGGERRLHASCFFKERCVLISCGPLAPLVAAFGEMPAGRFLTKAVMPNTLALTGPAGPASGPWRPSRCGGLEGVASGTVANRRGPGLGAAGVARKASARAIWVQPRRAHGSAGTPTAPPGSKEKEPLAPPPPSGSSSPVSVLRGAWQTVGAV